MTLSATSHFNHSYVPGSLVGLEKVDFLSDHDDGGHLRHRVRQIIGGMGRKGFLDFFDYVPVKPDPFYKTKEFLIQNFTTDEVGYASRGAAISFSDEVSIFSQGEHAGTLVERAYDKKGIFIAKHTILADEENLVFSPDPVKISETEYLLVWTTRFGDGSELAIFGQKLGKFGRKVGEKFTINTQSEGDQRLFGISSLEGGGCVAVYESFNVNTTDEEILTRPHLTYYEGTGILIQMFDKNAEKIGEEYVWKKPMLPQGNDTTTYAFPRVAGLASGDIAVCCVNVREEHLEQQVFDRNFKPKGPEWKKPIYSHRTLPAMAPFRNGGFVTAFHTSHGIFDNIKVIALSLFNPNGEQLNTIPIVNYLDGDCRYADVTTLDDRRFVGLWQMTESHNSSEDGIYGQLMRIDGKRLNPNFRVSKPSHENLLYSTVSALFKGAFAATWVLKVHHDTKNSHLSGQLGGCIFHTQESLLYDPWAAINQPETSAEMGSPKIGMIVGLSIMAATILLVVGLILKRVLQNSRMSQGFSDARSRPMVLLSSSSDESKDE